MKIRDWFFGIILMALVAVSGCAQAGVITPGAGIPVSTDPAQFIQKVDASETALPIQKTNGKLSARLQTLVSSDSLLQASLEQQARALHLPAQGPGSLIRDKEKRILVDIQLSDLSDSQQQALQKAGVIITHISTNYHILTGFVAPADLAGIEALPAVETIGEELKPLTSGGIVPRK